MEDSGIAVQCIGQVNLEVKDPQWPVLTSLGKGGVTICG